MNTAKNIGVAVALFVLYWVIFSSVMSRSEEDKAFIGAVAATIVSVFLFIKFTKRSN